MLKMRTVEKSSSVHSFFRINAKPKPLSINVWHIARNTFMSATVPKSDGSNILAIIILITKRMPCEDSFSIPLQITPCMVLFLSESISFNC